MTNNINKPRLVGEKQIKPVTIAPKTEVVIKEVSAPKKVVKRKKKSKK